MIRGYLDSRNKGKANNLQDALIGETAYKNGFVFVTRDNDCTRFSTNWVPR